MTEANTQEKHESRQALAFGFASPIVGLTLSLIIGMAVNDLFHTVDVWMGVLIVALIGASLVFGAHYSALAQLHSPSAKGAANAAAVLNLVVVSIWAYVTLAISISGGIMAVMALQDWGVNGDHMQLRAMNSDDFTNHLLPAVCMHLTLLIVTYLFVVLRSKGRKL